MTSCRTTRRALAPIVIRTAISLLRAAPRARSRFATFAHAISSTTPTIAMSASNGRRNWLPNRDQPVPPGATSRVEPSSASRRVALMVAETAAELICGQTTSRRAFNCSRERPGRGRARTRNHCAPASSSLAFSAFRYVRAASGSVISAASPTFAPVKAGGLTPTIMTGLPLMTSVRPIDWLMA